MIFSPEYLAHLQSYIGTCAEVVGTVDVEQVAKLAALLDRPSAPLAGEVLPPLWHWVLLAPCVRQSQLGIDGHARSSFFPLPQEGARRMWAGGTVAFDYPLRIGHRLRRVSMLKSAKLNTGRSGALLFVSLEHRLYSEENLAIVEEQTLVYREPTGRNARPTLTDPVVTPDDSWTRKAVVDQCSLLRYSALSYNTHRIHFDRPYAVSIEGYDGLVVQGPYLATLMMEAFLQEKPEAEVRGFSFRAVSPLIVKHTPEHFKICGHAGSDNVELKAVSQRGLTAMQATLTCNQRVALDQAIDETVES